VVEPFFAQDAGHGGIAQDSDVCVLFDVVHEVLDPHLARSTIISAVHLQTLCG
jgi:hypothetical protein